MHNINYSNLYKRRFYAWNMINIVIRNTIKVVKIVKIKKRMIIQLIKVASAVDTMIKRINAKNIDVCVKTSFYMRHKILDCIRKFMEIGDVDCVVEMDETFIPLSYKGNHKKSGFVMPRLSRKRGKQIKKRGISNEQVCIATAIDRNGNIIHGVIPFVDTRIKEYKNRTFVYATKSC